MALKTESNESVQAILKVIFSLNKWWSYTLRSRVKYVYKHTV